MTLSSDDRQKIETLDSGRYVVQALDQLDENDLHSVEVLLMERGEEWLSEKRLQRMTSLRLFQNVSAGVDHLNFSMIPESVIVCGNVGAYGAQIAEFVFAGILYFAKHLRIYHENLKIGIYSKYPIPEFLKGKTIAILGAGGIGKAVAKISKSFGMKTIGINTSGSADNYFEAMTTLDDVDEVVSSSDIIVVALPLTKKTRNLLNSRRLGLLKENCIIVNVARGDIIEKQALYDYLKAHPQSTAAIDVWWKYPKEDEKFSQDIPFFELQNFLGSPHISGDVPESTNIAMKQAIENIERFAENMPLKGIMNRNDYS